MLSAVTFILLGASFLYHIPCVTSPASDLLEIPPPVIYINSPTKCNSNLVKCKTLSRLDFCAHFCLWVFEGYLMLNVTFSVWAIRTDELSFELGAIEDDIESQTNPPTLSGDWTWIRNNNHVNKPIEIHHFRYSSTENPHYFRFKLPDMNYSGNIINYDTDKDKFELHLYVENNGVRTAKSLKGWLDHNGTTIQWTKFDIDDKPSDEKEFRFNDESFKWDDLPRQRGCYNWGPLDDYHFAPISKHCIPQPDIGQYDGVTFTFTEQEQKDLDELLNNGTSVCPVCDKKAEWKEYYACSQRFKSMQSESNRCQTERSILASIAKFICSSRLSLCIKFRSVTFTASKIELCPIPSINIITTGSNGLFDMADAEIPEANPVIFGCIDFPVTAGILSEMNQRMKTKFVAATKPKEIPWYVGAWEYTKIGLFTLLGILFIRFLLKKPPPNEGVDGDPYGDFDDAKFFEEYGDFYSEESSEYDEDDMYDDAF